LLLWGKYQTRKGKNRWEVPLTIGRERCVWDIRWGGQYSLEEKGGWFGEKREHPFLWGKIVPGDETQQLEEVRWLEGVPEVSFRF